MEGVFFSIIVRGPKFCTADECSESARALANFCIDKNWTSERQQAERQLDKNLTPLDPGPFRHFYSLASAKKQEIDWLDQNKDFLTVGVKFPDLVESGYY